MSCWAVPNKAQEVFGGPAGIAIIAAVLAENELQWLRDVQGRKCWLWELLKWSNVSSFLEPLNVKLGASCGSMAFGELHGAYLQYEVIGERAMLP